MSPQHRHPQTALLLLNPSARRVKSKTSAQILNHLQTSGLQVIQGFPHRPQDFAELIQAHRHQVDLVIVGGGDGTLNTVIDSLVTTHLPLGILPLGTANDLARTLNIPTSLAAACQVITQNYKRNIDLGRVNGKHFFNVASMGLSVNLTRQMTREVKQKWGILAYGIVALEIIFEARPFQATIMIDQVAHQTRTLQIAVGNGRYYGGGMTIAHDASIDDGRLDLYSLEIQHWWQILMLPWALFRGKYNRAFGIQTFSGTQFEIYTDQPHSINTDGEITVTTPAQFQIVPERSQFLSLPQSRYSGKYLF
ncbi:MAG: lipid kinase [Oscillatoriales cyanobacterium RM2_1_1]|nr:lipid kinase [Oscillatoriales cyanobacterium RM2_1_1]